MLRSTDLLLIDEGQARTSPTSADQTSRRTEGQAYRSDTSTFRSLCSGLWATSAASVGSRTASLSRRWRSGGRRLGRTGVSDGRCGGRRQRRRRAGTHGFHSRFRTTSRLWVGCRPGAGIETTTPLLRDLPEQRSVAGEWGRSTPGASTATVANRPAGARGERQRQSGGRHPTQLTTPPAQGLRRARRLPPPVGSAGARRHSSQALASRGGRI